MLNLNNTTPAAPAGQTLGIFQYDAFGNCTVYFGTGGPLRIPVYVPGVGSNSQVLFYGDLGIGYTIPASATSSTAKAKVAATGSTTFTILKNGTSIGTVNFAIGATTGIYTFASAVTFAAGDYLEIDGPGTADATLSGVTMTIYAART
jgi:hypothetical protein